MPEENTYTAPATDPQNPAKLGGAPGPHNYASLGQRFLGKLIDGLIMLPVQFVLIMVLGSIFVRNTSAGGIAAFAGGFNIIGNIVLGLLIMVCYIAIQWTFWKGSSQSIGKKVMKTQVVNLDGTPAAVATIAFNRYALITVISLVPFIGPLIMLVGILLIFRADRNCLHDDLAKTRVIKLPTTRP
jgi:uncharacterized RDD family membrane protein YckC